ncbi:MAG: hypothetical protein E7022_04345 [Desulfovibrio desulfuricans]|nr:hypothetical protein [Desulfovibrio desulfuricans]
MFIDYYKLLDIDTNSTFDEIKKAFRKQALLWHPDRNHNPTATERMALINEAYIILHDEESRARYDKEYEEYSKFVKSNENRKECNANKDYTIKDDILYEWLKKAKYKASELNNISLEDLLGMTIAAKNAFISTTINGFIAIVIVSFIGTIILLCIRS